MSKYSDFNITLGNNIMSRRRSMGASRRQLADKLRISHQQVRKYELGMDKVSAETLKKISSILSVSIIDLIDELPDTERLGVKGRLTIEASRNFMKLSDNSQYAINQLMKTLLEEVD